MINNTQNIKSNSNVVMGLTDRGTKIVDGNSTVSKESFLQLLVAQLQHQDPFDAEDPSKFIEQMATFSSLEQMTNLNSGMDLLLSITSGSLINSALTNTTNALGKKVDLEMPAEDDSGKFEKHTGIVKSTFIKDGRVYMEVELDNGELKEFPYESLIKIYGDEPIKKPGIVESDKDKPIEGLPDNVGLSVDNSNSKKILESIIRG